MKERLEMDKKYTRSTRESYEAGIECKIQFSTYEYEYNFAPAYAAQVACG